MKFNAEEYWEQRLNKNYGLKGVGFNSLSNSYNSWLYKIRKKVFQNLISTNNLHIKNKNILDMGSGTGFYIDLWIKSGAFNITGMDITNVAVYNLKQKFPNLTFYKEDISCLSQDFYKKKI